jgi:hypothetical protein
VLERGDEEDVAWLLGVFEREQIRRLLCRSRHLSPRSAAFWTLVFDTSTEAASGDS